MVKKLTDWVVTLSADRSGAEVKQALADAGFEVTEVMEAIGVIAGRASSSLLPKLRRIKGVADISPPPYASVGPPDAPIS